MIVIIAALSGLWSHCRPRIVIILQISRAETAKVHICRFLTEGFYFNWLRTICQRRHLQLSSIVIIIGIINCQGLSSSLLWRHNLPSPSLLPSWHDNLSSSASSSIVIVCDHQIVITVVIISIIIIDKVTIIIQPPSFPKASPSLIFIIHGLQMGHFQKPLCYQNWL